MQKTHFLKEEFTVYHYASPLLVIWFFIYKNILKEEKTALNYRRPFFPVFLVFLNEVLIWAH